VSQPLAVNHRRLVNLREPVIGHTGQRH
jgi:hypothetical protein